MTAALLAAAVGLSGTAASQLRPVRPGPLPLSPAGLAPIPPSALAPALPPPLRLRPLLAAPGEGAPRLDSLSGTVRTPRLEDALGALRRGSHPRDDFFLSVMGVLARMNPDLPLDPDRVFLIRDEELWSALELPAGAAGAARVLADGRSKAGVVALDARRPIPLPRFADYVLHEAVHLADGGILRVPHERRLKHWLAEGWTQLRSRARALEALKALGQDPGELLPAYGLETAVARAVLERHGPGPLDELVRTGSDAGLAAALGPRWGLLKTLEALDRLGPSRRDELLVLAERLIALPAVSAEGFAAAARELYDGRDPALIERAAAHLRPG